MFKTKKNKYILIALAVIIVIFGFGTYMKNYNKSDKPLAMEEKLEDFQYLYSFMSDNYPFLKLKQRVNGVDWIGEKDNFEDLIKNTNNDHEFIGEISKIVNKLNDIHTHTLNNDMYSQFYGIYSSFPEEFGFKPWIDVFEDETVVKRYKFEESESQVFNHQQGFLANHPACRTGIIIPDEVAYLKIEQMNNDRIEKDGIIIRDFFQEIKDYEKLIIDIRGNPGGNDSYWANNVVAPLINEGLSVDNYVVVRDQYGKNFYESRGYKFEPMANLDKNILANFQDEIIDDFDYYHRLNVAIDPKEPVGFQGDIYLLIDKNVYSSADSFASFSKNSGFAKLVGSPTNGGGISFDPVLFSLPNSGLVVRVSGGASVSDDGGFYEETGTLPDIEVDSTIGISYDRDKAIQYIINENATDKN